jgi:hypothetical protein
MNNERLDRMDKARHFLPEPGPLVVGELIEELRKAQNHLETAWAVIANAGVSLGDWKSMTPDWQEAAEKWRDEWLQMIVTESALEVCFCPVDVQSLSQSKGSPARPKPACGPVSLR